MERRSCDSTLTCIHRTMMNEDLKGEVTIEVRMSLHYKGMLNEGILKGENDDRK